jgi:hypothetical protein
VRDNAFRNVVMVALFVATAASTRSLEPAPLEPVPSSDCAALFARHVDRQANPRAGRLSVACRAAARPYYAEAPPSSSGPNEGRIQNLIGGSDLNLITGTETYPAVTQAGSMVWGHGTDVVAVYNDTKDAPASFSGISVSTDGGVNFTRLDPDPFGVVFTNDFGSPAVAYDDSAGLWLATTIASDCGGQGIGLMSSFTPADPASWGIETCPHSGVADDRPILWVDNNSASAFYGRRYIAFNDFDAGGALKVLYLDAGVWNEVVVDAGFIRNVHITGSRGTDGTVFIFGMDEGGGAGNNRINWVYRSTNGGVSWTSVSPGPSFPPAGAGLCSASDYFYMIPPVWRHMGWGQGAVGPGGVVHYVFSRAGQVPGDLGDIYYTRSTNNGVTWSSPAPLNTDQLAQNNVVQWQPSISVTSQGLVLASWYDRRETTDGLNYRYYGRMSLDNGATFLPEEPISDVAIPQPTQFDSNTDYCFAGDSNFHAPLENDTLVTWTDGRNTVFDGVSDVAQMDVYFDRVPLCPTINVSPTSLPNGQVTVGYDQTVTASGGTGPYGFALSGILPDGLGLNTSTGNIAGIPTTTGIAPFSIIATDSEGCQGSRSYNLIVDPDPGAGCPVISITPMILPDTTQGAPYSETVTASGGLAPYSYSVTSGELPTGLTLDPATGEIAGTAQESGSLSFAITATDANQCTGTQSYSPTVLCPTITFSQDTNLPDAFVGVPFLTNITGNGGTAPYTYEVVGGTVHSGIFTTSGGTLFGVTEGPGTKQPTFRATDTNGCTSADKKFRTDSVTCFAGDILCDDMTDATANFTASDQCGGGAEWYGTAGCLSSDDIGHSPSAHARWGTMLTCNDYGSVATQDSLDSSVFDVSNCNSGEVVLSFNYLLSLEDDHTKDRARVEVIADGGSPEVVADNGPGGPTCSGLPSPGIGNLTTWSGWQHLSLTLPATSTFQVSFVGETDDGNNNAGEGFFVDDVLLRCKCPEDLLLSPHVLPLAIVDIPYSEPIVMSGGAPPYTYGKPQGGNNPPPGLALDPVTGVLSGLATTPGIFDFAIVGTDSNFCKVLTVYNMIVSPQGCPTVTFTPDDVSNGIVGTFYSDVVTASGGTGPYVYTVTAGDLPPGLALDPDSGVISGTPTTAGIYQFTIGTVDADFCTGSVDYTIIINPIGCPVIDISPDTLPNAKTGEAYSETLTATGGVAPYVWAISHGSLPAGLTLDPDTGEISGIPSTNAVFSFAVAAQDASGCYGTRAYGIEVFANFFYTVEPCRVIDTRKPDGPLAGPALVAGASRTFPIAGACGIPSTAKAVSVNLVATQPDGKGNLRLYPSGTPVPPTSTINYTAGKTQSNNAIIPLSAAGEMDVFVGGQASGTVHFVLDVNGYFQ